jgi:hypothetical protein
MGGNGGRECQVFLQFVKDERYSGFRREANFSEIGKSSSPSEHNS